MRLLSRLFRRRRREEEGGETAGSEPEERVEQPGFKPGDNILVFVGSGKGGCGKSLVSGNLAIVVAALSRYRVLAIDADFDNMTLSLRLPPKDHYERLRNQVYDSLADIVISGRVRELRATMVEHKLQDCGGGVLRVELSLLPAVKPTMLAAQQTQLRYIDPVAFQASVVSLVRYLREAAKGYVIIVDGKQKSNIGINYEPLYATMLAESDIFLYVTEPQYLNVEEIVSVYGEYREKTTVVVNKVKPPDLEAVRAFVEDAKRYGLRYELVPYSLDDIKLYDGEATVPAARSLSRPTVTPVVHLAWKLGLLDEAILAKTGCKERVERIEKAYRVMEGGG